MQPIRYPSQRPIQRVVSAPISGAGRSLSPHFGAKPPADKEKRQLNIGFAEILMFLGSWMGINAAVQIGFNGPEALWSASRPAWKTTLTPDEAKTLDGEKRAMMSSKTIRFRYFAPAKDGKTFVEVPAEKATPEFDAFKSQWVDRFLEMFQNRPDLRSQIQNLSFDVKIYQSEALETRKGHLFAGNCDIRGNMKFAMGSSGDGLKDGYDGYEVVCHELSHFLDLLNSQGQIQQSFDGLLPGWNTQQKKLYTQARTAEKTAIKVGISPMRDYALESDEEFLGVLVETYFEKPNALKEANPTLYHLMNDFFKQNRVDSEHPSWVMLSLGAGGLMMVSSLGLILSGRPKGRKGSV